MCKDSSSAAPTQAEKEEIDSRSIYVGNVSVFSQLDLYYLYAHVFCFILSVVFILIVYND